MLLPYTNSTNYYYYDDKIILQFVKHQVRHLRKKILNQVLESQNLRYYFLIYKICKSLFCSTAMNVYA